MIGTMAQSRMPGFARDGGQNPAGQGVTPGFKRVTSGSPSISTQLFGPQGGITSSNPATLNTAPQSPIAVLAPMQQTVTMAPQRPVTVAPFPLPTLAPPVTGGPYLPLPGMPTDIPWGMIAIAAAATVTAVVVFHVMTTPAAPAERRSTRTRSSKASASSSASSSSPSSEPSQDLASEPF